MTCRHRDPPNNPDCSSYIPMADREAKMRQRLSVEIKKQIEAASPNPVDFDVLDVREVGPHLVAKVQYPNCAKCAYEGVKVMVFLNATLKQALRWRQVDPHFRDEATTERAAPSPSARFPASVEGWQDAIDYAHKKVATR